MSPLPPPPFRRVDVEEDDYEEGHVTGYAVQQPFNDVPAGFSRPDNHLFDTNENIPQSIAGNKAGLVQFEHFIFLIYRRLPFSCEHNFNPLLAILNY